MRRSLNKNITAQRIRDLRATEGLTQAQFAKSCKAESSIVSFWENGHNVPGTAALFQMCRSFDVTSDYVLGLTD